jgi:hypothetical protein
MVCNEECKHYVDGEEAIDNVVYDE